jgi:uncharacterized protein YicC (UPF0701 family)
MYGVAVPVGGDPRVVEALEGFAETIDAAVEEHLSWVLGEVKRDIERALEDYDPFRGLEGKHRLAALLESKIEGVRESVLNAVDTSISGESSLTEATLRDFLREM